MKHGYVKVRYLPKPIILITSLPQKPYFTGIVSLTLLVPVVVRSALSVTSKRRRMVEMCTWRVKKRTRTQVTFWLSFWLNFEFSCYGEDSSLLI